MQTICGKVIDVAIINKPYRNHGGAIWGKDQKGQAGLQARGDQAFQEILVYPEEDGGGGVHIYSCSAPLSDTLGDYKQMLSTLVSETRER